MSRLIFVDFDGVAAGPTRDIAHHKTQRGETTNMSPPESNAMVVWPETADELLLALQSYERLRCAYPRTAIELVLFYFTLTQGDIDAVLHSGQRVVAAMELFARHLDRFDRARCSVECVSAVDVQQQPKRKDRGSSRCAVFNHHLRQKKLERVAKQLPPYARHVTAHQNPRFTPGRFSTVHACPLPIAAP